MGESRAVPQCPYRCCLHGLWEPFSAGTQLVTRELGPAKPRGTKQKSREQEPKEEWSQQGDALSRGDRTAQGEPGLTPSASTCSVPTPAAPSAHTPPCWHPPQCRQAAAVHGSSRSDAKGWVTRKGPLCFLRQTRRGCSPACAGPIYLRFSLRSWRAHRSACLRCASMGTLGLGGWFWWYHRHQEGL